MSTKNIFFLSALALAFASCNSSDEIPSASVTSQQGKIVTLTTTIKADGASTRALIDNGDSTITVKWDVNGKLRVKYFNTNDAQVDAQAIITSVDDNGNATITADLVDPKGGTDVVFLYPYENWYPGNGQNGTLDLINQHYDSMRGQGGQMIVNGDKAILPSGIHMNHDNSILKLTLSDGTTDITRDVTNLTIDIAWIENGEVREIHHDISPSQLDVIYVAFNLPGHLDLNVRFTAMTATGVFKAEKSGVRLQGGRMYTTTPLIVSPTEIVEEETNTLQAPDDFRNGGDAFANN